MNSATFKITTCFLWFFLLFAECRNPFFVDTGIQQTAIDLSSPEEAIKQLKKAYEHRNIRLFEELLYSKEDFRFYVVHDKGYVDSNLFYINKNQVEKVAITQEVDFPVADDSTYIYLTYGEEVNIHRNMFRKTEQIVFGSFDPYWIAYFDTALYNGDSVCYDTVEAIVYLNETDIIMTSDLFSSLYGNRSVKFQVARQVFFMKKDAKGFWRIRHWFELGRRALLPLSLHPPRPGSAVRLSLAGAAGA